ncbi:MAG: hypothetical protein ACI8X5_001123 [Planctomycetota bacterium]|jgi:hypothetical protein
MKGIPGSVRTRCGEAQRTAENGKRHAFARKSAEEGRSLGVTNVLRDDTEVGPRFKGLATHRKSDSPQLPTKTASTTDSFD